MIPGGPLAIPRLPGRITRSWRVPGSKSITNRALVLAALAEGTSVLENVLESDDTRHMRDCLAGLGIAIRAGAADQLIVDGGRSRLRAPAGELAVGNSGTTVRFLAALAALGPGEVRLAGDAAMARRPIADLVDGSSVQDLITITTENEGEGACDALPRVVFEEPDPDDYVLR